ncbi:transcriptional regulator, MerR family [Beutenbergia cavernae DSM 12333]|uniref:Transcriptional regulator, MerR family n=1 Tax=Beutenbergia cavernae (strain ATCC BAA-8 / DSM 12333 / CCUG 43141 / JCM 11478 / NBRC 16432 / NCIMB 13614 / HKI 0122) TaxID=471853 RepID=C5BZX0_BEUC1|nr:MerR family transcriptional regulator [Beutenbergia cavernae]ACQ81300.1 transcriptional regulator, MerR family [Beutenbergia cavernae DSM 12333]
MKPVEAPTHPGERGGRPDLTAGADAPLTVAAVAARLGVAASTLRTWDRRYGLGPSRREAGSHRRYTPDDVARLETMRALTLRGVAPADAARIASQSAPSSLVHQPSGGDLLDPLSLAAAAIESDELRLRRVLLRAARTNGMVAAFSELVEPAVDILARRDRADAPGRAPEAVLAAAVLAVARELTTTPPASDAPRVLLYARAADTLAAHSLATGLATIGARCRILRPNRAEESARRAVDAVASADPDVLVVLGRAPGAESLVADVHAEGLAQVVCVGPRSPDIWLPGVHRVRTLAAAVHEIGDLLVASQRGAEASKRPGVPASDGGVDGGAARPAGTAPGADVD